VPIRGPVDTRFIEKVKSKRTTCIQWWNDRTIVPLLSRDVPTKGIHSLDHTQHRQEFHQQVLPGNQSFKARFIWEVLTPERQMEKVSPKTPSTESRRIGLDVSALLLEL